MLRWPLLIAADPHYADKRYEDATAELEDDDKCVLIAGGHPCPFLDQDQHCSIYPARPNVCVAMEAGDEQCQLARDQAGLPPLEPVALPAQPAPSLP